MEKLREMYHTTDIKDMSNRISVKTGVIVLIDFPYSYYGVYKKIENDELHYYLFAANSKNEDLHYIYKKGRKSVLESKVMCNYLRDEYRVENNANIILEQVDSENDVVVFKLIVI